MSKIIITADIHLTNQPEHEYRWGVFNNLGKHLERSDVKAAFILGDLVDVKDRHPAIFVNRVVEAIATLAEEKLVYVLMGNHDYIDSACPFFRFLDEIENVRYIRKPAIIAIKGCEILMLPHGLKWAPGASWREKFQLAKPWDLICAHETFNGSVASNGQVLEGKSLGLVSKQATAGAPVVSGDIHVPQKIGNVTYVGSPHPVAFGDSFEPSLLLWDLKKGSGERIKRSCIRRSVLEFRSGPDEIEVVNDIGVEQGDHVKIRYFGKSADLPAWPQIKEDLRTTLEDAGATVFDVEFVLEDDPGVQPSTVTSEQTPEDIYEDYCKHHRVADEFIEAGRRWL